MACRRCASNGLREFEGEIGIHFPEFRDLDKPPVLVFQRLAVCLHCGFTEFTVPLSELQSLTQGVSAARYETTNRTSSQ